MPGRWVSLAVLFSVLVASGKLGGAEGVSVVVTSGNVKANISSSISSATNLSAGVMRSTDGQVRPRADWPTYMVLSCNVI